MSGETRPAIMGIDPGLDGAVAWILAGRAEARITPTLPAGKGSRRAFDIPAMVSLLRQYEVELAVVEAVSAAPVAGRVQGTASMFGFGRGLGLWEGILAALGIPHLMVAPQSWKKVVLEGTARDKPAAIAFAGRRYPGVPLLPTPRSRVPHDGLADALCLAEYGRRHLVGRGGGTQETSPDADHPPRAMVESGPTRGRPAPRPGRESAKTSDGITVEDGSPGRRKST